MQVEEIEEYRKMILADLGKNFDSLGRKIGEYEKMLRIFPQIKDSLPEKTDVEDVLNGRRNKTVVVYEDRDGEVYSYEAVLYGYNADSDIIYFSHSQDGNDTGAAFRMNLFSSSAPILKIVDKETDEIIFENNHTNESVPIQKAYLLGKQAGLAAIEETKKLIDSLLAQDFQQKYSKKVKDLFDVEQWYFEGKKYLYPERLGDYARWLCRLVVSYGREDAQKAFDIIKALGEGASMQEIKTIVGDKDMSIIALCVLNCSKRGPEFYRAFSPLYLQADADEKEKLEATVQKVEAENEELESLEYVRKGIF